MKTFLLAVLLSASLSAEMYECKNSFLRVKSNSIVETFKDGKSRHATRTYGAFCYDFYDGDKKVYLCLEQNGNTFTWTSSKNKRTEKCTRID